MVTPDHGKELTPPRSPSKTPSPSSITPSTSTRPHTSNQVPVIDCLPPDCPVFRLPPASDSDFDTDSSLSSAGSLPSLLQLPPNIPTEHATLPDHTRRPANPGRLNAAWQALFRDALNPIPTEPANTPGPPPDLPTPLRTAPNDPVGHDFSKKCSGSFRIWDGNVNGLSAKDGYSALHNLCASLKNRSVDAIAIQEPNLDFLQADVRHSIRDICKAHFEYARVVTSTSCIQAPSVWKPGGSLLIIVGKWAQAVLRTSTDDLGRWTTVTLQGQDSTSVTLYSAYNVVKTTLKESGPSTVFAQQWQIFRLSGVVAPNPRQRFIDDLQRDIQIRTTNSEAIILVGDFNEQLGEDLKQ
jgi:hypothetical protein